ncbi:MAG TPA: lysophospholipid acyltransferase family protein [Fimbriiglobus sp.]|jgi:1-acyl-sn-glycerol-3-phosphate acyltransferase
MAFPGLTGKLTYPLSFWAAFWPMTLGWSFRATGRKNVPRSGPVLLLANHQSLLDPVPLDMASPRPLTFLARHTVFKYRVWSGILRYYGGIPIDRGHGKDGLRAVKAALGRGEAVVVFPEGERTRAGAVQPLKAGVTLIVQQFDGPIVPVGIAGAFEAWPRHQFLPRFCPLFIPDSGRGIAISFGKPIPATRFAGRDRAEVLHELNEAVRAEFDRANALRRKR